MKKRKQLIIMQIELVSKKMKQETYEWWFHRHDYNLELIAKISGVSLRSVNRWRQSAQLPRNMTLLVDQIRRGPIVSLAVFRGDVAIRDDFQPMVREIKSRFAETRDSSVSADRAWPQ